MNFNLTNIKILIFFPNKLKGISLQVAALNPDRICRHRWNFRISDVKGLLLAFVDIPSFVDHENFKRENQFFAAIDSVVDHHFVDESGFIELEKNPSRLLL